MTNRCQTRSGAIQCEKSPGHQGPCEATAPAYADFDSARELSRAARRIVAYEKALRSIADAADDWTTEQLKAVARKALAR